MIDDAIDRWKRHLRGELPGGLDELLDDEVVFYSPIVYTPQRGKAVTTMYLEAAGATLAGTGQGATGTGATGDGEGAGDGRPGGFRYTKQVAAGDTAVLEFETTLGGTYVNGVDIIRVNDAGRIVEFRVMIRPLQAVNAIHQAMKAALEA
jgi:hypothetical protein